MFDSDELLDIQLSADFHAIFKAKDKTQQYPATLSYRWEGNDYSIELELELRGNFRLENCSIPGLRLLLEKQKTGLFAKQKKFKMYREYLLQEYAIYRGYELLTEQSFKTRLAQVSYIDTSGKNEPW